jgi:Spy/CpxP family protein refolding chaperone
MPKYVTVILTLILIPVLVWSQEAPQPKVEKRVEIIKEGPGGTEIHKGHGKAQPQGPGKELCRRHGPCLAEQLKLTDEQKANLEKIRLKYKRERIPVEANLKLARLDLKEALQNLDQKKIDEAVKKINDYRGQLFQKGINEKVEFLKLLTPEQKKMLEEKRCPKPGMGFMGFDLPVIDLGDLPEKVQEMLPNFGFADLPFDFPMIEEEETEVEPHE